ncbi:MAG: choice-of-anchor B family protein [Bacteroidales bacterium]|nr:choice-of-anchor B family protein [Bacteroidales bacterium]MCF8403686.1 choice-of-anchor B family protein [Bacteroidales bacterium]
MKQTILSIAMIFTISLSFGQLNMGQLGHLPYAQSLSDIWGYVDNEGNEYALVGTFSGLSVVDVTDPANPSEVFFGPGPGSIWRDIKTWGDYAYVSNESDEGVYIVDLSALPGEITSTTNFTGSDYPFSSVHNLYIDESGKMYIFGADNGAGGAIICDLTNDPMNPVELGRFNEFYLHDGMARGDTLWGGGIYIGVLAAIDVSDPSSTSVMGTVNTPGLFCHNAWVSDDGSHVFTTDEVSSGYVGAFNVTDLSNMYETDRIQSNPGSNVIPHNVHVLNDYLITSYYTDGIVVHDASNPNNLIEVANYDTSPNYSGSGYNGSWGAYPFLPSGNILASDIEEGLFILSIEYLRASFLEGTVKDSISGDPLFNVQVEIFNTFLTTQTAFDGTYDFGTTLSGTFDVQFSKADYNTKIIEDVNFVNGEITQLDVEMRMTTITGVNSQIAEDQMAVFPNPFNSNFSIEFNFENTPTGAIKVQVFNMIGNKMLERDLSENKGVLSMGAELSKGIYFVNISDGQSLNITKRIVKY